LRASLRSIRVAETFVVLKKGISMCSSADCKPDLPPWLHFGVNCAWKHRDSIRRFAIMCGFAAVITGGLIYKFSPTDLARADADVDKARVIILSLDEEARQQLENARKHKKRLAEIRKSLEEEKDSKDTARLEWREAMADGNSRLQTAHYARHDNLLRLIAQYLRLLAEAECEILRAKGARDRGTPYVVAPRVQDLLAPILTKR
jgi:hypothetical protein